MFARNAVGSFAAILLLVVTSGAARAQWVREATHGAITDADGQPWCGARVTLVARPWRGVAVDEVSVTSDARGRFRAELVCGLDYQAWALGDCDATGRYRSTWIGECYAGGRVALSEVKGGSMRVRIRLPSSITTRTAAIRVRSHPHEAIPPFELTPSAEHEVVLPPVPGGRVQLEILGDGRLLRQIGIATSLEARQKERKRTDNAGDHGADLPIGLTVLRDPETPPNRLLLRVMAFGKPVAGARLRAQHTTTTTSISDEGGWAVVEHANEVPPGTLQALHVEVEAKGYATSHVACVFTTKKPGAPGAALPDGVLTLERGRDIAQAIAAGQPDLTVELSSSTPVTGRVMRDERTPASGLRLRCLFQPTRVSATGMPLPGKSDAQAVFLATAADGSFAIDGVAAGSFVQVEAILPEHACTLREGRAPQPIAWIADGTTRAGGLAIGDIPLNALPLADLRVQLSDGSPARFAPLLIATFVDVHPYLSARCDRLGRVRMLLARQDVFRIAVAFDTHTIDERVMVPATPAAPAASGAVIVTLPEPTWIRGRVVNRNGAGLPQASVTLRAFAPRNASLRGQLGNALTHTELDGRFRLAASGDDPMLLSASWNDGNRVYGPSSPVILHQGNEPNEIELVIGGAPDPKK